MAKPKRVVVTNLQTLSPSRKRLREGDIFTMRLPTDYYLYGRVIAVKMATGPMPEPNLLYIYKYQSQNKLAVDHSALTPNNLLVAPIFTNRLAWSKGLFETIENRDIKPHDLLVRYCFHDYTQRYFNEKGEDIPGPVEPVGDWGLDSYRTIDDKISRALGIELVPEDED